MYERTGPAIKFSAVKTFFNRSKSETETRRRERELSFLFKKFETDAS